MYDIFTHILSSIIFTVILTWLEIKKSENPIKNIMPKKSHTVFIWV